MDFLETLKELVAKAVTVAGTVFLSQNGFDALLKFMNAGESMPLQALSLVAAYAVWLKVVVPFVDALFKEATKTTATPGQPSWNTRSNLF